MKKHKVFLYPLEENGKIRVFLFQSGDIGENRNEGNIFEEIPSYSCPELGRKDIYVNGSDTEDDFKIEKRVMSKEEFDKLKELEYAYNNREN